MKTIKEEIKLLVQYVNEQGLTVTAKVTHEHFIRLAQQFEINILR